MFCIYYQAVEEEESKTEPAPNNSKDYMPDIISSLTSNFTRAIRAALPELPANACKAVLTVATNPKFGDYQCNSAMSLVQVRLTLGYY